MSDTINALAQYASLYSDHSDLVDSNSAPPLNALRPAALEHLSSLTLPKKGSEDFEVTDMQEMLSTDYGVNLKRIVPPVNVAEVFHCGVPNLSTSLFLNINGVTLRTEKAVQGLPEGVWAGSLRTFANERPEIVEKYYGKLADLDNPIVALDTLLTQDGFVLYVGKGIRLERPLQLVNIINGSEPQMAVRRVLVIVEEDAEAKLLVCDHTNSEDGAPNMALRTLEMFVEDNARLEYYDLEESSRATRRLSSLYLRQGEGSDVLIDAITLFNGSTRNEYYTRFAGPHAHLSLIGMGIEDDDRRLATHSEVRHEVGHCSTDELFKYVVDDAACGSFSGRIYVAPGAVKTEAYQSNKNIVGTDGARMFSKPQLEIYNDDVKCSHGTAIGQLDELQLFYMRTRGLSESEAKLLLKQAFMADVVERIRIEALRERLHNLVERRFAGYDFSCGSCPTSCK